MGKTLFFFWHACVGVERERKGAEMYINIYMHTRIRVYSGNEMAYKLFTIWPVFFSLSLSLSLQPRTFSRPPRHVSNVTRFINNSLIIIFFCLFQPFLSHCHYIRTSLSNLLSFMSKQTNPGRRGDKKKKIGNPEEEEKCVEMRSPARLCIERSLKAIGMKMSR